LQTCILRFQPDAKFFQRWLRPGKVEWVAIGSKRGFVCEIVGQRMGGCVRLHAVSDNAAQLFEPVPTRQIRVANQVLLVSSFEKLRFLFQILLTVMPVDTKTWRLHLKNSLKVSFRVFHNRDTEFAELLIQTGSPRLVTGRTVPRHDELISAEGP